MVGSLSWPNEQSGLGIGTFNPQMSHLDFFLHVHTAVTPGWCGMESTICSRCCLDGLPECRHFAFPAQQTEIIFHFVHSTLKKRNLQQINPPCQSVGGKRYAGWTRSDKTSVFRAGRLHFASAAKTHSHYSTVRYALSNYTYYLGGREQGQKHLITSNDSLIA